MTPNDPPNWRRYADRLLAILLTAGLLAAGGMKIISPPEHFAAWGIPRWATTAVGLFEWLCMAGLWRSPWAPVAPVGAMTALAAAVGAHVWHGDMGDVGPAVALLVIAATLGHLRRDALFAMMKR